MANDLLVDDKPIEKNELSISETVDLLKDDNVSDDNNESSVEKVEKPEKKEKEVEKEDESEEEEVEIVDDKDEDLEFANIPKRQEILKEFPELFKKFPALERAFYREQQFTEHFTTPAEAKEALERLDDYNALEKKLLDEGDLASVLNSVRESSKESFEKIAVNYLVALNAVDPNAFNFNVGNILKQGAVNMYEAGKASGDENLMAAAEIMHNFMFQTKEITPPRIPRIGQKSEADNKLSEEKKQFDQERLNTAIQSVDEKIEGVLENTITKHLDPKNVMTDYVRSKAKEDILSKLDKELESDTRFKKIIDKLWAESRENNYSQKSKDRIKEAWLNKARTVLPDILRSVRSNALKGSGKREALNQNRDEAPISRGRVAPERSSTPKKASDIPRSMSSLEFLNSD